MSFSIGGRTYNATFVGDCTVDFNDPEPGSSLSVPIEGEMDTLTRPYKVRLDHKALVQRQLGRLKGKKKDFEFQSMTLFSWSVTEDGPSAKFTVTFKGCFDGKLPNPKLTGGTTSGQVLATITGGFLQKKIDYLAPTATWRYVTRGIPRGPRFEGQMPNEAKVQYQNGNGGDGDIAVNELEKDLAPGFTFTPINGRYNLRKRIRTTNFAFEQIGGYCQVEETNSVIIEPFNWMEQFTG